MADGLKGQWGVSDPAKASSDRQSQDFQAAFQKELSAINTMLAATAPIAETAPQQSMADRKLSLVAAFQGALGRVDPADPTKAKGEIDKVLADARTLSTDVGKFQSAVEKAHANWETRQPRFDEAVTHVEELETWGDAAAPALRGATDAIRQLTNDRKYSEANSATDAMLANLEPVYAEYQRQKTAKEQFDPAWETLRTQLADASKCQYHKFEDAQADLLKAQDELEQSSTAKDYVKALDLLNALSVNFHAFQDSLADFEKQKKSYEEALATLQPRVESAKAPQIKLAALQNELLAVNDEMSKSAESEDYEAAAKSQGALSEKLDSFESARTAIDKDKQTYEAKLAELKPRLTNMCTDQNAALTSLQTELVAAQNSMEEAAGKEEYPQALALLQTLTSMLDDYKNTEAGQLYKIHWNNTDYFGTAEELALLKLKIAESAIKEALPPLRNRADSNEQWYRDLKAIHDDQIIVATIVNALGGASLDSIATAAGGQQPALDAVVQALSSDLPSAKPSYEAAVAAVNATSAAISAYYEALDKGGSRAITALEIVEVTCFAIGAAAGAAALAPAGAGMLATAGANAAAGAGFGALQSIAESTAHNVIQTGAKPISPAEIVSKAAVAAVVNGVGAALGSVASKQLGSLVAAKIVARLGLEQAASKALVNEIVQGSIGNTVQTVVSQAPGLIEGKTTWDAFAVKVAEAFLAGGIGGAIAGKVNRNSPLFKNLSDEEFEAAWKECEGGTMLQLPGKNPKTGQGLQDIKTKFDPNKPIAHHENMDFKGIDGAPNAKTEVRRHSANPNAPEGSYSQDNPTTQINSGKKYRLPDGTWKKFDDMTPEEKAAAHMD